MPATDKLVLSASRAAPNRSRVEARAIRNGGASYEFRARGAVGRGLADIRGARPPSLLVDGPVSELRGDGGR